MAVVINVYGKADLKQIEKAEAQLSGMKREVATQPGFWSRLGSVVTSTGAKIASGLAAAGIARWLGGSIAAAQESEAVQVRLQKAVAATGTSWATQGSKIDALIQKHSMLAAVDDEQLAGAFSTLTQTSGSASKAMQHLGLVTDLARGANIDLNTSAKLIGKVLAGNTSSLSRYGIVLKEGATTQEAIAAIQKRFAGQAKAYGQSSAGAGDRFRVSLGNLQETVGGALLPTFERMMGFLNKLLIGFQKLPGPIQNVVIGVGAVATAGILLAPFMESIIAVTKAMKLSAVASKLWAAAQWVLNAAMSANPVGLVIVAIAALVAIFVVAWKKSETFRRIVIGAWNAIKSAAVAVFGFVANYIKAWVGIIRAVLGKVKAVADSVVRFFGSMRDGIVGAFNRVTDFLRTVAGKIKSAIGNPGKILYEVGKDIVAGLRNGISAAWHWVTDKLKSLISGLSSAAKKVLGINSPSRVFANIGSSIGEGMVAGIDASADVVARAVAGLAGVTVNAAAPTFAAAPAGGGGRSIVIAAGAVQVTVNGGSADAGQIAASIDPALVRLAREIGRL